MAAAANLKVRLIVSSILVAGTWHLPAFCLPLEPAEPEPIPPKVAAKAEALFVKGHEALDRKDVRDAEVFYRKAIALNPTVSKYHRQLSLLLTSMSRGQEAEREALLAASIDPEDWRSQLTVAHIYVLEGRLGEANTVYKKVLPMLPKEHGALAEQLNRAITQNELALKKVQERERKKREHYEQLHDHHM